MVEGYSTPAFWMLSNRGGPMPRKEVCFSIVTELRTLDLAADSAIEAEMWKRALGTYVYVHFFCAYMLAHIVCDSSFD